VSTSENSPFFQSGSLWL